MVVNSNIKEVAGFVAFYTLLPVLYGLLFAVTIVGFLSFTANQDRGVQWNNTYQPDGYKSLALREFEKRNSLHVTSNSNSKRVKQSDKGWLQAQMHTSNYKFKY